ncbi:MAG: type II toxin-antitoxin system RelE/ParE family toxin [Sphingopyxis sp.]
MRVFWTRPARSDLQAAIDYLADENPLLALDLLIEADRIDVLLRGVPLAGPRLDGTDHRKLRLGRLPYVIRYRIKRSVLEILRLHHARSDWKP